MLHSTVNLISSFMEPPYSKSDDSIPAWAIFQGLLRPSSSIGFDGWVKVYQKRINRSSKYMLFPWLKQHGVPYAAGTFAVYTLLLTEFYYRTTYPFFFFKTTVEIWGQTISWIEPMTWTHYWQLRYASGSQRWIFLRVGLEKYIIFDA